VVDLIVRKREGGALAREQITDLISGYVRGRVPDSQLAAWLMAVVWRGMTEEETCALTEALAAGGSRLRLRDVAPFVVDKHSTGGVGDNTSLVVAPLVAAAGIPVGKVSGRGLGFAGGTIDKLESFTGIRLELDGAAFRTSLARVGVALSMQSARLAPGDKAIYALRDLTGTVESASLIAASVMSKKLAAGASGVVLDVKAGGCGSSGGRSTSR
jgi:pyrimidine-nucleoside phosphorylase